MITRILILFFFISITSSVSSQCFLVPSEVCVGDCGPLFYLQNDPPGTTYQWSITCGTITNDTLANPHTVCFNSSGTCTIQVIIEPPGEAPDTCTMTVEVLPPSLSVIVESVCDGDSIEINGMYYTPGFYTDTIFGGAANGCDSILLITVNGLPIDTTNLTYTGCEGDGYSVVVNGATYDEANPSGIEILVGSDGCDSIVIINLVFLPNSTSEFIYIGCEGDSFFIIINNVLYNESNPTGTETLVASNGCDSIITISLTFFPTIHDTISYMGCSGDGYSVVVGDSIYNEDNPTGIDTLFGGCDTIIVIDLHFDTLNPSLTINGNQLCVSPAGLQYTWMTCDSLPLSDTTECITVQGVGCACVIVTNGACIDTLCHDYEVCELTCEINALQGACLGDSVLLTATTNATDSAVLNWTITLDSVAGVMYNDMDSIWEAFNSPGCYTIDLTVLDLGCVTTCSDTICITEKPLADLCCSQVVCDTCVTLNIYLFGNPPWEIAITDGNSIDTIQGISNSQYDYIACPPFGDNLYTLLWVRDSLGYCEGGVINDTASVYIESKPVASINISGDTLCAFPQGLAYNWSDCENTSNLGSGSCFIPAESGCYCLTVSSLITDCIDTACVEFILTHTESPDENENFNLWYDKGQHSIIISSIYKFPDDPHLQLTDLQGRAIPYVKKEFIGNGLMRVTLREHVPSMLFVSVVTEKIRFARGLFVP